MKTVNRDEDGPRGYCWPVVGGVRGEGVLALAARVSREERWERQEQGGAIGRERRGATGAGRCHRTGATVAGPGSGGARHGRSVACSRDGCGWVVWV
ncbi:hypothetical protein GUJ93_ZPchr0012g21803 [Zizania palustris]|uniref:Uncharacterized protein n=1 Tax=Zizania palustris TaxID=103762 RepID=A0A8J6BSN3_ZIZPA|nr:hypothetical protein GUJ93_ZPchr0012g21803 [Zizania palustris]